MQGLPKAVLCQVQDHHEELPALAQRLGWETYEFSIYIPGISAMHLHRELNCKQKSAWYVVHRLREARRAGSLPPMEGAAGAEIDEKFIGGLEKNKHARQEVRAGRGGVGKMVVAGMRDH